MPAPNNHVQLFISCVSNEFGHYREAIRDDLKRHNLTASIQEDFKAGGVPTLEKLDKYIMGCRAIIHLCGDMTGGMANSVSIEYINDQYKDFGKRFPELIPVLEGKEYLSYTQWEAYLAIYHKKVLIIATPADGTVKDDRYLADDDQREHQRLHLNRLRKYGFYDEIKFKTEDELIKKVALSSLLDILPRKTNAKPINLPYHSIGSLFKGRDTAVQNLRDSLTKNNEGQHAAAIVGNTIYGLGGIGKTRLSVEYAWQYKETYTALLFVIADTPEKLYTNLASLCGPLVLDLPEQAAREEEIKYNAVINWLKQNPGWLLILDNVDTEESAENVEDLFAQLQGGHVMITSRVSTWSEQVNQLLLDILLEEDAISFLLERTDKHRRKELSDYEVAKEIVTDLGNLALALEQAGAYISTRKLTLAQYRTAWIANNEKILAWYDPRVMMYPKSVATTWQTSFDQLSAKARTLLNRLSWFAPDPVPESILDVTIPDVEQIDSLDALIELEHYSLATRSKEKPEFIIHRLVQEVTRRMLGKTEGKENLNDALNWINEAFIGDPADVNSWAILEPLISHVAILIKWGNMTFTPSKSRLISEAGKLLYSKTQYKEAEVLLRLALAVDKKNLAKNIPV